MEQHINNPYGYSNEEWDDYMEEYYAKETQEEQGRIRKNIETAKRSEYYRKNRAYL